MTWAADIVLGKILSLYRDYSLIRRSKILRNVDYARKYMSGLALLAPFAALHYVLIGEKRGCLPNAFFDPLFVFKTTRCGSLAEYLREPKHWGIHTSEIFDGVFYLETYYAYLSAAENPLVHFIKKGVAADFCPTRQFDMTFFRRAITRDHTDKMRFAMMHRDDLVNGPLNAVELRQAQDRFREGIRIEVLRDRSPVRRRFLVWIQAGCGFDLPVLPKSRSFDIWINYFERGNLKTIDEASIVTVQTGTKTTAIHKVCSEKPELLEGYEAILFLDDDVEWQAEQIEMLFSLFEENELDLAQASLTADSACFFPVLRQPEVGSEIRRVTAVEIMMPVLSQRALKACSWVFGTAVSGWCVDALLGREVRKAFGSTVAVIGPVQLAHRRATNVHDGAYYSFLWRHKIRASTEAGYISIAYDISDKITMIRELDPFETVEKTVEPADES